jgi:hypothetical protein
LHLERRHFYAFLSYSHCDSGWARWMHVKLERYQLPGSFVGTFNRDGIMPARIYPVFRDREELPTSATLNDSIRSALQRSRYLIVICSPAASRSRWVNEEVRYFKELGRADRIFALIVSGTPHASDGSHPEHECFPPALRYQVGEDGQISDERTEPGAASVNPEQDGRDGALLKVIAGILGVDPGRLADRERQRIRRRRLGQAAMGLGGLSIFLNAAWAWVALFGVALIMVGVWWDYARVKVDYYALLTWRWGLPVGDQWLAPNERAHRSYCWRFESSRHRVRRVLQVNSAGRLSRTDVNDESVREYRMFYNEAGSIAATEEWDGHGKLIERGVYNENLQIVRFEAGTSGLPSAQRASILDSVGNFSDIKPGRPVLAFRNVITAHRRSYTRDGLVEKSEFLDTWMRPCPDGAGVFGWRYDYEENGWITCTTNLDRDGRPAIGSDGLAMRENRYDARGNVITETYRDREGRLAFNEQGVAERRFEYDAISRFVRVITVDTIGHPTVMLDGFAEIRVRYTSQGFVEMITYYDAQGEPTYNTHGVAGFSAEYDTAGNRVREVSLDTFGKPTYSNELFSEGRFCFDDSGNPIEEAWYDAKGQPCVCKSGWWKRIRRFDTSGRMTREIYFGIDGAPVLGPDGAYASETRYNEVGLVEDYRLLNPAGHLMLSSVKGYARKTSRYDPRGNRIEDAFFGIDGKPVRSEEGIARIETSYDESGRLIGECYYGPDNQLALRKNDNYGIAGWTVTIADQTLEVSLATFGPDGQPMCSPQIGSERMTVTHDALGRGKKVRCFDGQGRPALSFLGFHRLDFDFDNRGRIVAMSYFGLDDRPIAHQTGPAKAMIAYDDIHRATVHTYWNANGAATTDSSGVHRLIQYKDERGRLVEVESFDTDGKLVARRVALYDERGRHIGAAYYGPDGNLVVGKEGFATMRAEFDQRNNVIQIAYFGVQGEPVVSTEGYARAQWTYNAKGQVISVVSYGVNGESILAQFGIDRLAYCYDESGHRVEEAYLTADGALQVFPAAGFARVTIAYDARGNQVDVALFGADNQPIADENGIARRISVYDDCDRMIECATFGRDGTPVKNEHGVYRVVLHYDLRGFMIRAENYGPDGKAGLSVHGVHRAIYVPNERGDCIETTFFGVDGTPSRYILFGARIASRYDARGNEIECSHYDIDGKLMLMSKGYARVAREYDRNGQLIAERYFGPTGEQLPKPLQPSP